MDEKHWFSKRVTGNELTLTNAAGFYALCQIRAGQFNWFVAHFC
jgi:hypothetical protein